MRMKTRVQELTELAASLAKRCMEVDAALDPLRAELKALLAKRWKDRLDGARVEKLVRLLPTEERRLQGLKDDLAACMAKREKALANAASLETARSVKRENDRQRQAERHLIKTEYKKTRSFLKAVARLSPEYNAEVRAAPRMVALLWNRFSRRADAPRARDGRGRYQRAHDWIDVQSLPRLDSRSVLFRRPFHYNPNAVGALRGDGRTVECKVYPDDDRWVRLDYVEVAARLPNRPSYGKGRIYWCCPRCTKKARFLYALWHELLCIACVKREMSQYRAKKALAYPSQVPTEPFDGRL